GVEKCSFTVVNSAFSPCYQKNRKQSEQLQPFFSRMLSSYTRARNLRLVLASQLTLGFPDSGVEKCAFTVVNSSFSPCYQGNRKQFEQLRDVFNGC
ncbi:MAG: hypothetical protein Q9M26_04105, partial [Mariprofundales bacterium]|nr:hypothetical protein [Mariprofundales bacterium]